MSQVPDQHENRLACLGDLLAAPTSCTTRCSLQEKCLWTVLHRIHSFCTEIVLLYHRQKAGYVTEIPFEVALHYIACLLSSRNATRGISFNK